MGLFEAVVLAIVQGLTEFLPVSSDGHLILVPSLLGWERFGLGFDVMLHAGTLLATLLYFRADVARLAAALFGRRPEQASDRRLALLLLGATVPSVVVVFALEPFVSGVERRPVEQQIVIAAVGLLITSVVLGGSELIARTEGKTFAADRGLGRHPVGEGTSGRCRAGLRGAAGRLALGPDDLGGAGARHHARRIGTFLLLAVHTDHRCGHRQEVARHRAGPRLAAPAERHVDRRRRDRGGRVRGDLVSDPLRPQALAVVVLCLHRICRYPAVDTLRTLESGASLRGTETHQQLLSHPIRSEAHVLSVARRLACDPRRPVQARHHRSRPVGARRGAHDRGSQHGQRGGRRGRSRRAQDGLRRGRVPGADRPAALGGLVLHPSRDPRGAHRVGHRSVSARHHLAGRPDDT